MAKIGSELLMSSGGVSWAVNISNFRIATLLAATIFHKFLFRDSQINKKQFVVIVENVNKRF